MDNETKSLVNQTVRLKKDSHLFKLNIDMHVWDDESIALSERYSVFYIKDIELPFPPYPGLGIRLPKYGSLGRVWNIKSVSWDAEEQYFMCQLDDQFTNYPDTLSLEEYSERLKENGWLPIDENLKNEV